VEKEHGGELLHHLVLLHGASQYGHVGRYTQRTPPLLWSLLSSSSSSSNRTGGSKGGGKDIVQASEDHLN
jgi:hypothetical protein